MRRKLGILLMALGLAMLAASVGLVAWNQQEANQAEAASAELQRSLSEAIALYRTEEPTAPTLPDPSAKPEMKAIEVNGRLCVGFVAIPKLKLELPVLAKCTDENLKTSPCLYSGTTMEDDLVLAAHNYRRHFGPIRRLKPGDQVYFVDAEGGTICYQVAAVDAVPPTAVEEVCSGQFDMTLVTCTYGGTTRLVVYCDRQTTA